VPPATQAMDGASPDMRRILRDGGGEVASGRGCDAAAPTSAVAVFDTPIRSRLDALVSRADARVAG